MILGRKKRARSDTGEAADNELLDTADGATDDVAEEDAEPDSDQKPTEVDLREDGPFDIEEVDLDADGVERITFGPLIITPFPGLNVQLHGEQSSGKVFALLAAFEQSALELTLFAAPTSGGLATELREDIVDEVVRAGGSAEEGTGPFGSELRAVLPVSGPEGEQLFHVSRFWLVDGPRWLLRGRLLGQAALVEGREAPADVFVEFFRNVVVDRDEAPRVPGELIHLARPEGAAQG